MFRKMRRFKQELSKDECIEVLKSEPRGVLSVMGDDGYPYGVPMDHWYDEVSGKLYFHGRVFDTCSIIESLETAEIRLFLCQILHLFLLYGVVFI